MVFNNIPAKKLEHPWKVCIDQGKKLKLQQNVKKLQVNKKMMMMMSITNQLMNVLKIEIKIINLIFDF